MNGNTIELNNAQRTSLAQFKERITDCRLPDRSDDELVKWLIVRNYDVDQAEKLLRKSLEWRKVSKIDDLCNTFKVPEVFTKFFSMSRSGTDKYGCPVWYSSFGQMDMKGFAQSLTKKDLNRVNAYTLEKMMQAIREENNNQGGRATISRQVIVYDMEGLALKQITNKAGIDVLLDFLNMMENYYPDIMRKMIIVNASSLFSMLFNIIKPFLNKVTVDKMFIYGSNKAEWQEVLLKEIAAEQLPTVYGGSCKTSQLNMGGDVPKSYYLVNSTPVPETSMETLNVSAGSNGKKQLQYPISTANSILRWKFMTEGGEIAYRVFRKSLPEIELIPSNKVESHLMFEENEIICDSPGNYIIEFDNSFSYMKSKKVRYSIAVIPPTSAP